MGPVGVVLGNDPHATVREMTRDVVRAERAGFEMVLFSESNASLRDSVSALASFALATERIRLAAIQVVRLRTPLLLAETAATLDELSNGRLTLALGAFTRRHAARHGEEPSRPETTLREYLAVCRDLLTGAPVTCAGEWIRMNGTSLGWKPPRADIEFWVAASSIKGLENAARVGDGVYLDGATSPEYTANAVARIRRARAAAGLDMSRFRVAQVINTSIARTSKEALAAVRGVTAGRFRLPQPAAAKVAVGEPYLTPADLEDFLTTFRSGGAAALEERFSDELVAALSASGTPEQVRDRVDQYRNAGVELPLLRATDPGQFEALLKTFGTGTGG